MVAVVGAKMMATKRMLVVVEQVVVESSDQLSIRWQRLVRRFRSAVRVLLVPLVGMAVMGRTRSGRRLRPSTPSTGRVVWEVVASLAVRVE